MSLVRIAVTYEKGEMRYIQIHQPSVSGPARTPQKIKHSENIKLAMFPPVSALGIAAMTMIAKVPV